jgi:hypothetical protein
LLTRYGRRNVCDRWEAAIGLSKFEGLQRGQLVSAKKTRIMYIEDKSQGLDGPACIGRVTFSKTGRSLTYGGRTFRSLGGSGFKANYADVDNGDQFWISGPRRDGKDRLYEGSAKPVEVDDDVSAEHWRDIRGK